MTNSNILVTGGSGFIGSNLVDLLVKNDHSVIVVDNLSTGLLANENPEARYYRHDIIDYIAKPGLIEQLLKKNDIQVVYHLAASADIGRSMADPVNFYQNNLLGSIALLNACNDYGIQKFIFASTSAVIGEPEYLPVDEQHKTAPISPYGLTKLNFEQYISYFSLNSQIKFTSLRFPNVFGLRQRPDLEGGVVAIFKEMVSAREQIIVFGDGEQTRDWVNVSDITSALIASMQVDHQHEIISLGSSIGISVNELVASMESILGRSLNCRHVEPRTGDIRHMVMDGSKAKTVLGWEPKMKFEKGLKNLLEGK